MARRRGLIDFVDTYDVRARLAPALVAAAPGVIALGALVSIEQLAIVQWIAGICAIGVAVLTTAIVRDRGKALEPLLYAEWGGKPTSIILRYSDRTLDTLLKTRYRLSLEKLVPGFRAPSSHEELSDASAADRRYDTAVRWLIERTTDRAKFPKVFAHNCGYGFRRNLLGLKPFGFGSSALATVIATWILYSSGLVIASLLSFSVAILGWLVVGMVVNRSFVKRAAFDYAIHLVGASDGM
jgi:hypothetical protein